jgi:hypothetical protein
MGEAAVGATGIEPARRAKRQKAMETRMDITK